MKRHHALIDMIVLTTIVLVSFSNSVRTFVHLIQSRRTPVFTDFPAYYLAAQLLNEGISPYDTSRMQAAALAIGLGGTPDYIYPPFFAVFFRPLTHLSYPVAWYTWFCCNLIFLIIVMVLLLKSVRLPYTISIIVGVSLATIQPVTKTLQFGQVNILLMLLFAVAIFVMNRTTESSVGSRVAGLLWGIAVAIKLTPGIAVVVFLLRRQVAALAALVGAVALLLLVGVLAGGGVATLTDWWTIGLPQASTAANKMFYQNSNLSIYAVTDHLFSSHDIFFKNEQGSIVYCKSHALIESPAFGTLAGRAGAGLVACFTCLCLVLRIRKQHEAHAFLWDIALVLAALTLISPLVWSHYYVWLIIPMVALIQRYTQSRTVRLLLIVACFLLNLDASDASAIPFVPLSLLFVTGFFANVLVWGLLVTSTLRDWWRSRPLPLAQSSPQPSPDYPARGSAHPS